MLQQPEDHHTQNKYVRQIPFSLKMLQKENCFQSNYVNKLPAINLKKNDQVEKKLRFKKVTRFIISSPTHFSTNKSSLPPFLSQSLQILDHRLRFSTTYVRCKPALSRLGLALMHYMQMSMKSDLRTKSAFIDESK